MNIRELLQNIGLRFDANSRLDAKYTGILSRELEAMKSRTYDIKYPELKARQFVPVSTSVDPGAETITYQQWDEIGMADIIANYADDLPRVDALKEEFTNRVVSIGDSYEYSIQDLRRAAMSGAPLKDKRAKAARRGVELRIDDITATGVAKSKLKGFINHPNVTVLAATSDGTSARWVGGRTTPKTPDLIKMDMHDSVSEIFTGTKQTFLADTIILPTVEWSYISQAQVGTENQTTILKTFLDNNPTITNVDFWYKLDLADAAGTGPRMVTYKRDPEVLELEIPQDFEQFAPQAQNLAFVVNTHARVGGVVMYYPLGVVYTDGI